MTTLEPPFVVVAGRAGRAIPVASRSYPPRGVPVARERALAFAEAFADAGFASAAVTTGSDEEIAGVLDQHDAEWPFTFEIELASDLDETEHRQAAYHYGPALAPEWLMGLDVTSPN